MDSHRDPDPTPEELAGERWVLSLLDEVGQEVHAPRRLRLHVEAAARARRRPVVRTARGGRPRLRGALAGAGAVAPPPAPDPEAPAVKLSERDERVSGSAARARAHGPAA